MSDGAITLHIGENRPITASLITTTGTETIVAATVQLLYGDTLLPVQYPYNFQTEIACVLVNPGPSKIVTVEFQLDLTIPGWCAGNYLANFDLIDVSGVHYEVNINVAIAQP
jgi:hypothetical protein